MIIKPYQMERRSSHDSNQLLTFFLENIVVPILLKTEESIYKNERLEDLQIWLPTNYYQIA